MKSPVRPVIIGQPARLPGYSTSRTDDIFRATGNTGNLAFRYAVAMQVGWQAAVFPPNASADAVMKAGDIAVLPCANQVGNHTDQGGKARLISELSIPVVAVGLGAQSSAEDEIPSVPHGTVRWLREIASRGHSSRPNISVRGEYSRRVLEYLGIHNVEVLGCPSLFISPNPVLGRRIFARRQSPGFEVTVAAGNPQRLANAPVEKKLIEISLKTGGDYIVQHPLPFVKAARKEIVDIPAPWIQKLQSFCGVEGQSGQSPLPPNSTVYFDVDAWMERLRRSDFVVGMRIHGVMLAIQAGIPALCITHDTRTSELCKIMKLPRVSASQILAMGSYPDDLKRVFDEQFDPVEFDNNRIALALKYQRFLVGAGLNASSVLQKLVTGGSE